MVNGVIHAMRGYNNKNSGHVYVACEYLLLLRSASLDRIGKRIISHESIEPDIQAYRSLLAEYSLFGLFDDLGRRHDWEVSYPIDCKWESRNGAITPLNIGRRLDIEYVSKKRRCQTEIDGLLSIRFDDREAWAVLEAKSGVQRPTLREINKHVTAVRTATGKNPHYILGVPHDNLMMGQADYHRNARDAVISNGGIIVTFDESAEDFENKAKSMFDEAAGAVRNKRRQKAGVA
ncbi:MAG: hypothetical protein JXC85_06535 [Candidatus Aenigmarchaeota archaeon]|nr:hypothetical protein [Candidatus Aenigmarchaeota archaeon]